MNHRTGRGVELPLHQPILCSQLQHFAGIKDVLEWWPATILVRLEDHGQFKRWRDAWVREEAASRPQAIFELHADRDGGTSEPTGLVRAEVHDVPSHPVNHAAGQQQHLAVQRGNLGLRQTALDLPAHVLEKLLLFVLKVRVGN